MTEEDAKLLIETAHIAKNNEGRIDKLEDKIEEIRNDQKIMYKLATSVEVIAQRVTNIEAKVDDTNKKVDAQIKSWQETDKKLAEEISKVGNEPLIQTSKNVNSIKVAVISCIVTALASGMIMAIVQFIK